MPTGFSALWHCSSAHVYYSTHSNSAMRTQKWCNSSNTNNGRYSAVRKRRSREYLLQAWQIQRSSVKASSNEYQREVSEHKQHLVI